MYTKVKPAMFYSSYSLKLSIKKCSGQIPVGSHSVFTFERGEPLAKPMGWPQVNLPY
jgi:hypothetical protein